MHALLPPVPDPGPETPGQTPVQWAPLLAQPWPSEVAMGPPTEPFAAEDMLVDEARPAPIQLGTTLGTSRLPR